MQNIIKYCISCRNDVNARQVSDCAYNCLNCNEQTTNFPINLLRTQPASTTIQKYVNSLIIDLIRKLENYIEENPKKGFFSRSTNQFIDVLKDHVWSLNVTSRGSDLTVGKYEKALSYWGGFSASKLSDKTLESIYTIEMLYTKVELQFSKPEKAINELGFYPTITKIRELRSNYMIATYGGTRLPQNVIVGLDES